jgi:hypothetical protein
MHTADLLALALIDPELAADERRARALDELDRIAQDLEAADEADEARLLARGAALLARLAAV